MSGSTRATSKLEAPAATHEKSRSWPQTLLLVAALGMGALEAFMVFFTDVWAVALVFGLWFLGGAWWVTRRWSSWAVAFLTLAFVLELLPLPFYPRSGTLDWATQGIDGVLSLAGVVAGSALLVGARRR